MSTTLYRFYGPRNKLLYVGITDDFPRRMLAHSQKHWWAQVRASKTEEFDSRRDAEAAERRAIRAEYPMYNLAGNTFKPVTSVANLGTVEDAAKLIGVSTKTIRRWLTDGRIEGARFGERAIRVDLDSLLTMQEPINTWAYKNELDGATAL